MRRVASNTDLLSVAKKRCKNNALCIMHDKCHVASCISAIAELARANGYRKVGVGIGAWVGMSRNVGGYRCGPGELGHVPQMRMNASALPSCCYGS